MRRCFCRLRRTALAEAAFALAAGCGGGAGRIRPPNYSGGAGADALEAYDGNRDGAIAGDELIRVPGLLASIAHVDSDHDKRVTAREVDDRIGGWVQTRVGEMPVRCMVTLDGAALADAVVLFDPEPFLGPDLHPASGTTTESGFAGMSMAKEYLADPKYFGVACGWYKIRVTHKSRPLPACYNTETVLGCEVAMDARWLNDGEIRIALKSSGQ